MTKLIAWFKQFIDAFLLGLKHQRTAHDAALERVINLWHLLEYPSPVWENADYKVNVVLYRIDPMSNEAVRDTMDDVFAAEVPDTSGRLWITRYGPAKYEMSGFKYARVLDRIGLDNLYTHELEAFAATMERLVQRDPRYRDAHVK